MKSATKKASQTHKEDTNMPVAPTALTIGRFTFLPRLEMVDGRILSLPRVIVDFGIGPRGIHEEDSDDEESAASDQPPLCTEECLSQVPELADPEETHTFTITTCIAPHAGAA